MKNLRENGYITVSPEGSISLLPAGQEIADKIYERHTLITDLLTALGVDPEVAAEDACRIEHIISEESFEALKKAVHELREQENAAKKKAVSEA